MKPNENDLTSIQEQKPREKRKYRQIPEKYHRIVFLFLHLHVGCCWSAAVTAADCETNLLNIHPSNCRL